MPFLSALLIAIYDCGKSGKMKIVLPWLRVGYSIMPPEYVVAIFPGVLPRVELFERSHVFCPQLIDQLEFFAAVLRMKFFQRYPLLLKQPARQGSSRTT